MHAPALQSPQPPSQLAICTTPLTQRPSPCITLYTSLPHEPQLNTSLVRSTSHPLKVGTRRRATAQCVQVSKSQLILSARVPSQDRHQHCCKFMRTAVAVAIPKRACIDGHHAVAARCRINLHHVIKCSRIISCNMHLRKCNSQHAHWGARKHHCRMHRSQPEYSSPLRIHPLQLQNGKRFQ